MVTMVIIMTMVMIMHEYDKTSMTNVVSMTEAMTIMTTIVMTEPANKTRHMI